MININFKPETFFDLSDCSFAEIFNNKNQVWEVLKDIGSFLENQFKTGKIKANFNNSDNIYVGSNTIIEEGALIKGPAIIGNNSVIAHGAYLRPNCIIDNNVTIGHASEIKNSIVFSNSAIAHLNYIGDSVIGKRVNIGGGAKTANFRLDGNTIPVKFEGEKIDTGLTKFGAVLGDDTKIGVNAVLNPGTILGKGVQVFPLALVFGTHPEQSVIK